MSTETVTLRADSGPVVCPLVEVRVPHLLHRENRSNTSGNIGRVTLEGPEGDVVQGQYDRCRGLLSFVVDRGLAAGEERTYRVLDESALPPPEGAKERFETSAEVKADRVVMRVADEPFATYVFGGTRRPYFWPVLGPAGASVVRGQGGTDHPHHTGLVVNYGGHSEGGAVNIWSDWDEPPYGPGGRVMHGGFRHVKGGPVYGEIVEDLSYVDPDGDIFASEVRSVRWWWGSANLRFIDLHCQVMEFHDRTPGPFLVMARVPGSFGLPDYGEVTNSLGKPPPSKVYKPKDYFDAAWIDASGPTGKPPAERPEGPPEYLPDLKERMDALKSVGTGPWNGIAILDSADNHGFPNSIGRYSVVPQLVQAHFPPTAAPNGPFGFRKRIVIHDGNAQAAQIGGLSNDYISPPRILNG